MAVLLEKSANHQSLYNKSCEIWLTEPLTVNAISMTKMIWLVFIHLLDRKLKLPAPVNI